ncbi:hypothetical protein GHK33_20245 [Sinorhizobium meliloti]|uniref:hypothetical protein n=1 Tax=Rhizobium meliloti TaxID=382 RepID=UPI001294C9AD|nr:hypothetical protein [Sinorhizobium meliloti]MQW64882.1 hypothetical protein [Sinorhizobium meliloti]
MLRSLRSVHDLARGLEFMAPAAVSAAGGGDGLVALYGKPTGAGFWSVRSAPEELWAAMAAEHQAEHRGALPAAR